MPSIYSLVVWGSAIGDSGGGLEPAGPRQIYRLRISGSCTSTRALAIERRS